MEKKIRVRFAPSPTGSIHVGNARTALFNWLIARQSNGEMVFRLEDTDVERSSLESIESIKKDMNWLGFDWDDGPYLQSERLELYRQKAKELEESGAVYKCFCSAEELEAKRENQMKEGKTPMYDGTCTHLTKEEVQAKVDAGVPFSYRFKVTEKSITLNDLVRGEILFDLKETGDFVVMRPNGYPVYNFSVVIDDALMGITHILRGEDILPSTPKQIMLYKALGFDAPQFGHLSMINGPTGRPLHKRDGATSLSSFREAGYVPEAMFNFLALLGWSPKGDNEILEKEDIISSFSIKDVSKSPAQFNYEKLKWMNGQYLHKKSDEEILDLITPILSERYSGFSSLADDRKLAVAKAVKPRVELISESVEQARVFFEKAEITEAEAVEMSSSEDYRVVVDSFKTVLANYSEIRLEDQKAITKEVQKLSGRKGKALFMNLRIALTGEMHGADLEYIFFVLGKDEMLKRVSQ
ncbi:glutamate--tRNA ligase [bacterium]|nr:glutamate--tRNA ligase [bacterium]